jgi:hypothetical protein
MNLFLNLYLYKIKITFFLLISGKIEKFWNKIKFKIKKINIKKRNCKSEIYKHGPCHEPNKYERNNSTP